MTARRIGRGVRAASSRPAAAARASTRRQVVVAAGAIHTPALLARNGLGGPQLGRNLSLHPATAVWALMDEVVDMARGVPQSYFVDEFASDGIMLEGIAGPPDYVAMGLPVAGERHRELMAGYRTMAQFGLMISDDSRGRVHSLGRAAGRPLRPRPTPTPPASSPASSSSPSCSGPPAPGASCSPPGPQAGARDPARRSPTSAPATSS